MKKINFFKNAVFYMWFDQQALQLRFNIITGDVQTCPFECKVQLYTIAEPILSGAYVVFSVPFEVRYGIHIKKEELFTIWTALKKCQADFVFPPDILQYIMKKVWKVSKWIEQE